MEDSQVEDGTKGLHAGPRSVVKGCRFFLTALHHHQPAFLTKLRHRAVPSVNGCPPMRSPHAMGRTMRAGRCSYGPETLSHTQSKVMHAPLDLKCAPTFRIVPMASLLTIAEVAKRTGRRACLRSRRGRAAVFTGWDARRGAQWIAPLSTSAATPQTARKDHCPKGWSEIG